MVWILPSASSGEPLATLLDTAWAAGATYEQVAANMNQGKLNCKGFSLGAVSTSLSGGLSGLVVGSYVPVLLRYLLQDPACALDPSLVTCAQFVMQSNPTYFQVATLLAAPTTAVWDVNQSLHITRANLQLLVSDPRVNVNELFPAQPSDWVQTTSGMHRSSWLAFVLHELRPEQLGDSDRVLALMKCLLKGGCFQRAPYLLGWCSLRAVILHAAGVLHPFLTVEEAKVDLKYAQQMHKSLDAYADLLSSLVAVGLKQTGGPRTCTARPPDAADALSIGFVCTGDDVEKALVYAEERLSASVMQGGHRGVLQFRSARAPLLGPVD
jgi:hypothetical protein